MVRPATAKSRVQEVLPKDSSLSSASQRAAMTKKEERNKAPRKTKATGQRTSTTDRRPKTTMQGNTRVAASENENTVLPKSG